MKLKSYLNKTLIALSAAIMASATVWAEAPCTAIVNPGADATT